MSNRSKHWKSDLLGLFVAVVFASSAAAIMAKTEAPPLAIAFWRNAIAGLVLAPMLFKYRSNLISLESGKWRPLISAGVFLGIHFASWVPSVKLTSVTSATALVATQVVWAAVIATIAGRKSPKIQYLGISISFAGVLVLTGIDFAISPQALLGDILALVGAVLVAAYMFQGKKVRAHLPLSVFTAVVYLIAAATLLIICLTFNVPLFGYSLESWLLIAAVTLFAQFGGHSLYNRALRSFSPTAVATTILFQIPVSSIIGWVLVNQVPEILLIPAAVMIGVGMVIVIRSERPKSVELEAGID